MGGNKIDPIFISKEAAAVLTARAHDSLSVAESDYDGYCALNRRVERERDQENGNADDADGWMYDYTKASIPYHTRCGHYIIVSPDGRACFTDSFLLMRVTINVPLP